MDLTRISRYLSLILRHKPWVAGVTLDRHGWADVEELLAGVSRKYPINKEILEEIVRTDNKQRYSFNDEKTKIRANQGHSIPVDVELPVVTAEPEELSGPPYGLAFTSSDLDDAYFKFAEVKDLIRELAETENCIYRLAYAIKKAQKRANALQNIVIPGLDSEIARISDALEEKEREEFVRLKVVKAREPQDEV